MNSIRRLDDNPFIIIRIQWTVIIEIYRHTKFVDWIKNVDFT